MSDEPRYEIVRFRMGRKTRVIRKGVTLAEAQAHCNDPLTQGRDEYDGFRRMDGGKSQ